MSESRSRARGLKLNIFFCWVDDETLAILSDEVLERNGVEHFCTPCWIEIFEVREAEQQFVAAMVLTTQNISSQ